MASQSRPLALFQRRASLPAIPVSRVGQLYTDKETQKVLGVDEAGYTRAGDVRKVNLEHYDGSDSDYDTVDDWTMDGPKDKKEKKKKKKPEQPGSQHARGRRPSHQFPITTTLLPHSASHGTAGADHHTARHSCLPPHPEAHTEKEATARPLPSCMFPPPQQGRNFLSPDPATQPWIAWNSEPPSYHAPPPPGGRRPSLPLVTEESELMKPPSQDRRRPSLPQLPKLFVNYKEQSQELQLDAPVRTDLPPPKCKQHPYKPSSVQVPSQPAITEVNSPEKGDDTDYMSMNEVQQQREERRKSQENSQRESSPSDDYENLSAVKKNRKPCVPPPPPEDGQEQTADVTAHVSSPEDVQNDQAPLTCDDLVNLKSILRKIGKDDVDSNKPPDIIPQGRTKGQVDQAEAIGNKLSLPTQDSGESSDDDHAYEDCEAIVKDIPARNKDSLAQYDWYHGNVSRHDAEQRLLGVGEDGTFLVRQSKNDPQQPYTMAVLLKQRVNNLRVRLRKGDNQFMLGEDKDIQMFFKDVPEMVKFHKTNPLRLLCGSSIGEIVLQKTPDKT